MAAAGRYLSLRLRVPDRPGSLAALGLATGQTDLAARKLREGEQLGEAYRQVATRNGYRECQGALPL